jgi:peptidyl-dipeptidase Dcp
MHRGEDSAQLRYFMILPGYQGIGLGKRLMELFMEFLRQGGYRSAYLWTVDELPVAAALYRRHGFRLTEEKPSTAYGRPLREQRYDLVLEPVTLGGAAAPAASKE